MRTGDRVRARCLAVTLATLALVALGLVGRADAFVYWTEKGIDTIGRANLNGTGPNQTFVSGLDEPQAMAVDSAHIYWITGFSSIGRANLNGTGASDTFILGTFGAQGVAVDTAHVYWTNSGPNGDGIGRANIDGSAPTQNFINTPVPAAGVAVDGSHVYWANSGINTIGRANLDGSSPNQFFITGAENPQGVAVDGAHIYWANGDSGTIGRANLDGSSPNQFFLFAGAVQGVAVDTSHVWWTNGRPFYAIGRANLDGSLPNQRFLSTLSAPTGIAVDALVAPSPGPGPAPPPTITQLVADVQGAGLPRGTERGLLAKVRVAQRKLDAGNRPAACGSLGAFSNSVDALSERRLNGDDAAELIADATEIGQLVGCGAD